MIKGLGSRLVSVLLAVLVLLGIAGCHHPAERYPEAHPGAWTPTDVETMLGGEDPCEPWNRSMFACTDFLMDYVADPVGRVYTSIFPRPFVEHFNNVCVNLEYPARLFSSLLRAEWGAAGDETLRFLLNTTVGIIGIFDVAQSWFHIPSSDADFGSTFAHWGIGSGHTFMLPIIPSLNGRDLVGMLFDSLFDIKTYIPYAGYATFLNRMVIAHSGYSSVTDDALDPYKNFRQLMLLRKELMIRMWFYRHIKQQIAMYKKSAAGKTVLPAQEVAADVRRPKPEGIKANWHELGFFNSQNPVTDSLRMMMFQPQTDYDKWYMPRSLFDSSFNGKRSVFKLELIPDRPRARYSYYERKIDEKKPVVKREELVLILPGIGGSINTSGAVALAEIFHRKDCKVAVFDSTFNWNFIVSDSKGKLPGFLPDDAERVRSLIKAALADMRKRKLIPENCRITLAGYSLGGLHTLKIAELEKMSPQLAIERFIAVNPPVSLRHALERIDELAGTSANWSKTQLLKKLHDACGKAFVLFTKRYQTFSGDKEDKNYRIDVEDDVARIFAGFYLRLALRDVLLASHREKALPGLPAYRWGRRHKLYETIDRVTMREYAEKFLLPNYPGKSLDELFRLSELQSFADVIKDHPGVKIIHNYDDFLLNDTERRYLDEVFASKLTWFSNGGHLGNLYYLPVRNVLASPIPDDRER